MVAGWSVHSVVCNVNAHRKTRDQNVQSDVHSFPRSNADVYATDRQRRRSLSLKPVKASSATRQLALGIQSQVSYREKGKIIFRHDISKDQSCKCDARLGKSNLQT